MSETGYAISQTGISHLQFRVLIWLAEMTSEGETVAPIDRLTTSSETSEEQVHRAIQAMQRKGLISARLRYGKFRHPATGDQCLGYYGDLIP